MKAQVKLAILITATREATVEDHYSVFSDNICSAIHKYSDNTILRMSDIVLIHGDARGGDRVADKIGRDYGLTMERYPADWSKGRGAGHERNRTMIQRLLCYGLSGIPICCVAFFGIGLKNKGTGGCYEAAKKAGVPVEKVETTIQNARN